MHKTNLAKAAPNAFGVAFKRNKIEPYNPSLLPIYIGPLVSGSVIQILIVPFRTPCLINSTVSNTIERII